MSVSLSVSSVLCLSHSYAPYPSIQVRMSDYQSYTQRTFFLFLFRLFASISCYIIRIAMCSSTYLSHSYTQCLPYVSVSLSIPPLYYAIMSLSHVYNCVRLSCHILVSTLTDRINLHAMHVSLIARPPDCLFVLCV